jgi:hypothetical protein
MLGRERERENAIMTEQKLHGHVDNLYGIHSLTDYCSMIRVIDNENV